MQKTKTESKSILVDEISKISNINFRFHRISSMLLDHFIMTMVTVPLMILVVILLSKQVISFDNDSLFKSVVFFLILFIYLNKDFLRGKSPAKRILGYQVVNVKTEQSATELQCFIRNLTIAIAWPIEVVVGYVNPQRRIGDYIANTKVVSSDKEKLKSIWTDLKTKKLKLNVIFIVIIGVVYFYGLNILMPI